LAALCTILGGPNGSGKSSLYRALAPPGEFVNADMIARHLNPADPASASLLAGRTVLRRLSALIGQRRDFVWETTLSSNQALALMRRAYTAGYEIGLVFVVLARAELNVDRVAQRVSQGGHHIPEDPFVGVMTRRSRNSRTPFRWPTPQRSLTIPSAFLRCSCALPDTTSRRIGSTRLSLCMRGSARPWLTPGT
jgi:predicted ABC-type ATPase